jgi:hypothetical protein
MHLATLKQEDRFVGERSVTVEAEGRSTLNDLVGGHHQMERLPAVADLSAGLLATFLP